MPIFILYPWLALGPAGILAVLWLWRPRRIAAVTAAFWAGYAVYEYLMKVRVLCSGECNIRVDLLLIHPALLLMSIIALVSTLRRRKPS